MTTTEIALTNKILEQGWAEGAVTPERTSNLLERLNSNYKSRLAEVAINSTELEDFSDIDSLEFAA